MKHRRYHKLSIIFRYYCICAKWTQSIFTQVSKVTSCSSMHKNNFEYDGFFPLQIRKKNYLFDNIWINFVRLSNIILWYLMIALLSIDNNNTWVLEKNDLVIIESAFKQHARITRVFFSYYFFLIISFIDY